MGIRYQVDEELKKQVMSIAEVLGMRHVDFDSISCLRSFGSSSRGVIARCHALGKVLQMGLGRKGFYAIEIIHERFSKLSEGDQVKTLIHELMHIPRSFGGGFRHHDHVCERNVNKVYKHYLKMNEDRTLLDF